MKKRKILYLFPLAALILSGCDFSPEGILKSARDFLSDKVVNPVKDFFGPAEKEEPKEEKHDDEKPEEQGGEQGEGGEQTPAKTLQSISVSGEFKTEYDLGESFDPTGIVVTAAYDDGSSEDVSSQVSFSGFSSEAKGPVTVTVTFEGQTAEIQLIVAKLSWTIEEKALFDTYLHGIELPFFSVEGATVIFDSEDGYLHILDEAGADLQVSGTQIPDYAALFTEEDGWDNVSADYSAYSSAPEGSFFVFEKSTQTDEGMRRISVQLFGENGSSYSLEGSFHLYANDPFNYEFPSAQIAAEFAKYNMPAFQIPAPDAEDMYFEFYPDSNNAMYVSYGFPEYLNATIYLYGFTQNTFDAYLEKLSNAGWTLNGVEKSGVMVYSGELEIENEGKAIIEQLYYTPSFSSLTYDYMIQAPAAWPAEAAAALVEKFAPGSTTVIPECPNGESYTPYMSSSYNEIDVEGPETLKDAYAAILREAGWKEIEEYVFVSPNQDIQIVLQFTSYGLEIRVSGYTAPSAQWPAEDAAKLLPAGGQDTLPPFEGANSYQYYNDNYGSGITCFVGEGNEETAMAAYGETLEDAGFIPGNSGFYKSPHDEFQVELWKGTDGAFNIEVTIIAHWPTADIASKLSVLVPNVTDSLPVFEGANKYTVTASDTKVRIALQFGTSSAATAKQAEYITMLLEANFEFAGNDEYGDPYYNSPNGQFCVNPWVSSSALVLDVYAGEFVPPVAGFPSEEVETILKAVKSDLKDSVPAYDVDVPFVVDDSGYYALIELALACSSSSEANAHVTAYTAVLAEAGYTEAGNGNYGGTEYLSPNGEIYVYPYVYGSTFYIDINLAA